CRAARELSRRDPRPASKLLHQLSPSSAVDVKSGSMTPPAMSNSPAMQALARIDRWLASHRPDYYAQLRAGASVGELADFEGHLHVTVPMACADLYRWRNGQQSDCSEALTQNWMFMPLGDIAETKELMDGMIGFDFEDPRWWRRGWIPFLHNGGGSYLCLDLA